jgi:hypothetical protein
MSMQAIWGQIGFYTEESNTNLLKKLKKLTRNPDISVSVLVNIGVVGVR